MRAVFASLWALVATSGALAAATGTSGSIDTSAGATATITYSTAYDIPSTCMNTVACSNGKHGLENQGFTTLGSLPQFPYVGGVHGITWKDDILCGTCWKLNYGNKSLVVQAVDASPGQDFTIAKKAMQDLTNGEGIRAGNVKATYSQVNYPKH